MFYSPELTSQKLINRLLHSRVQDWRLVGGRISSECGVRSDCREPCSDPLSTDKHSSTHTQEARTHLFCNRLVSRLLTWSRLFKISPTCCWTYFCVVSRTRQRVRDTFLFPQRDIAIVNISQWSSTNLFSNYRCFVNAIYADSWLVSSCVCKA